MRNRSTVVPSRNRKTDAGTEISKKTKNAVQASSTDANINATRADAGARHALPEFDEGKLRAKPWIARGSRDKEQGYVLLDGKLVPYNFLDYLKANRPWNVIVYGTIIDPHSLLGDETWDQLDEDEREIAPACILHMIKSGDIFVNYMLGEDDLR